jgi:hypothetical protein
MICIIFSSCGAFIILVLNFFNLAKIFFTKAVYKTSNPLPVRIFAGYQQGVDIYGFAMSVRGDIFVLCLKNQGLITKT